MRIKFIVIILLLITISGHAQTINNLAVVNGKVTKYIPVYDREGTIYIAAKPLADALSVNYFYYPNEEKIELNFPSTDLYITAQNPFLILKEKNSGKSYIYQLPTSTYLLNKEVFIPLKYCMEILKKASGMEMNLTSPDALTVSKKLLTEKESAGKELNVIEGSGPDREYDISGVSISEKANGTLIRVSSTKRIYSYYSNFKNGILTFVFRNVRADINNIDSQNNQGLIKWIRARNLKHDTEIQIHVNKEYTSNEVLNVNNSNDILIALYSKAFENRINKKKEKAKWNFNVIVIDPGHGGKDPGTIGIDGIEEKNITLAIALKLGQDIKKQMKGVKVVFTRKTDKFVPLYRRGQIANEAGGNLFISIHCNATPHKPSSVHGFEIYLLRPGKTKDAIQIAERENSVIKYEDDPARYKKLTAENFILVSMAQSAYMRYSEKFAELLNKEFSKDTSIRSLGVRQAGFYVLVGASMPSVLIETGFLSNRRNAHYLNSKRGQAKIAEAILQAIEKFRSIYEKNIEAE